MRRGDKTRFFSHISHDHEVHHDLELLFALSFMTDNEKEKVINLMKARIERVTNLEEIRAEGVSSAPVNNVEIVETHSMDESSFNNETSEATLDETSDANDQIDEASANVDDYEEANNKMSDSISSASPLSRVRGMKACNICGKKMIKGNINRHMKGFHKLTSEDIKKHTFLKGVKQEAQEEVTSSKMKRKALKNNMGNDKSKDLKMKMCKLCFKEVKSVSFSQHLTSGRSYKEI